VLLESILNLLFACDSSTDKNCKREFIYKLIAKEKQEENRVKFIYVRKPVVRRNCMNPEGRRTGCERLSKKLDMWKREGGKVPIPARLQL